MSGANAVFAEYALKSSVSLSRRGAA